jgi:hypothetical protein
VEELGGEGPLRDREIGEALCWWWWKGGGKVSVVGFGVDERFGGVERDGGKWMAKDVRWK